MSVDGLGFSGCKFSVDGSFLTDFLKRVKYPFVHENIHEQYSYFFADIRSIDDDDRGNSRGRRYSHSFLALAARAGIRRARAEAFFIEQKQKQLIKPALIESYLVAFEELDLASATARNWGYLKPLLFAVVKERLQNRNLCRLMNDLKWWNPTTGEVAKQNPTLTVQEAVAEAQRLGLGHEFKLARHILVKFDFRNENELPINNVSIVVDRIDEKNVPKATIFKSRHPLSEIAGKHSFNIAAEAYFPMDRPIPSELRFRLRIDYDLMGVAQPTRELFTKYDSSRDYWLLEG